MRGVLLVLSGPSGSGKTTIARRIAAESPEVSFSVSATTRRPRPGETDGVDYHFWSAERFAEAFRGGEFLEHAEVYGAQRYGTPRRFVEEELAAGRDVVLDIDVQGGLQVQEQLPEAVLVFVLPGEAREGTAAWERALRERLRSRGSEDEEEISRRLGFMRAEIEQEEKYDHVVVNDDLERAVARIQAIRRAAREGWSKPGPAGRPAARTGEAEPECPR